MCEEQPQGSVISLLGVTAEPLTPVLRRLRQEGCCQLEARLSLHSKFQASWAHIDPRAGAQTHSREEVQGCNAQDVRPGGEVPEAAEDSPCLPLPQFTQLCSGPGLVVVAATSFGSCESAASQTK